MCVYIVKGCVDVYLVLSEEVCGCVLSEGLWMCT